MAKAERLQPAARGVVIAPGDVRVRLRRGGTRAEAAGHHLLRVSQDFAGNAFHWVMEMGWALDHEADQTSTQARGSATAARWKYSRARVISKASSARTGRKWIEVRYDADSPDDDLSKVFFDPREDEDPDFNPDSCRKPSGTRAASCCAAAARCPTWTSARSPTWSGGCGAPSSPRASRHRRASSSSPTSVLHA